jgi:superfamily II DNA/RNA helicase
VIGTPGKVWTLIGMRVLDTSAIKVFVLDEADEMLMVGSLGDMTKRIRSKLPKKVQTLFFSATWTVRARPVLSRRKRRKRRKRRVGGRLTRRRCAPPLSLACLRSR